MSWETRRFNRFNELVRELGDIDDFEMTPLRREYIETPGGKIPRKISGATMKVVIDRLNEEIPEGGA